jgi:hypothetical protein
MVSLTPRPLKPGETAPGTHSIGGWLGPGAGLDAVAKTKFLKVYHHHHHHHHVVVVTMVIIIANQLTP